MGALSRFRPLDRGVTFGDEGIRFFLESASQLVMDLRVQLSSCVPSTHMETTGARLSAADLVPFMDHPKVIGLAEFMNYPGLLAKVPDVIDKLAAFQGGIIDGHSPLLRGRELNAYLACGICNCHETTSAEEELIPEAKGRVESTSMTTGFNARKLRVNRSIVACT